MQLNGIGSNHNTDMHHVTNCVHNHKTSQEPRGAAMAPSTLIASQQTLLQQSAESVFSWTGWMQDVLGRTKSIWGKIWGGEDSVETAADTKMHAVEAADKITVQLDRMLQEDSLVEEYSLMQEQSLMQDNSLMQENEILQEGVLDATEVATASVVVPPPQTIENNPYFSAVEDTGRQQQTLWQKIRIRFENITGYLTKHFSFSNRNSFQAKQEQSKEDLRRKSRYREDELEIDCVITDESYLMDSYNKKGEYSTISVQK